MAIAGPSRLEVLHWIVRSAFGERINHQERNDYHQSHDSAVNLGSLINGACVELEIERAESLSPLRDWLKSDQMRVLETVAIIFRRGGKRTNGQALRITREKCSVRDVKAGRLDMPIGLERSQDFHCVTLIVKGQSGGAVRRDNFPKKSQSCSAM